MSNVHTHDHHDSGAKSIFGIWIYILSDAIMFAALFSAYAVLHDQTYGAAGIQQVATLPFILVATYVLLFSSLTVGFANVAMKKGCAKAAWFWLLVTALCSLAFVLMQETSFANLIYSGNTWQKSAFLSAFFTLVGCHWIHVIIGIVWAVILMIQMAYQGTSASMQTRFKCLGMFVHYMNVVWVFIFAIVYLMGAM